MHRIAYYLCSTHVSDNPTHPAVICAPVPLLFSPCAVTRTCCLVWTQLCLSRGSGACPGWPALPQRKQAAGEVVVKLEPTRVVVVVVV